MIERTTRKRPCRQCGELYEVPVTAEERNGVRQGYCSRVCDEADVKPKEPRARVSIRRTASTSKRRPISPASTAQREKVKRTSCFVTGRTEEVDPAHVISRAHGGCDDESCVLPLWRPIHDALDGRRQDGKLFDLLPWITEHKPYDVIQHAITHTGCDLIALVERLSGCRVVLVPRTELLTLEQLEERAA